MYFSMPLSLPFGMGVHSVSLDIGNKASFLKFFSGADSNVLNLNRDSGLWSFSSIGFILKVCR